MPQPAQRCDSLVIGVPVRNQLPFVRMCLETLAERRPEGSRVLIVDDASDTACLRYLEEFGARIRGVDVLRNRRQRGFPYICNEIVHNSQEECICFLNSDTLVAPGWADYMLEVMALHPSFGAVGPSTSFTHTEQALPGLLESRMAQDASSVAAIGRVVFHCYRAQCEPLPTLGGFCFLVKRQVVRTIGYFDERFGLGSGEEDDFIARARSAGFLSVWVKYAYVHHFGHCSFTQEMGQRSATLWAQNRLIYEIKRMRPAMHEIVHSPALPENPWEQE